MTAERTPDGRYIVVSGRLWRASNPGLPDPVREQLVKQLMDARRRVRSANPTAKASARQDVNAAKHGLGERGPVWWTDGAPDYNRHLAKNTPYGPWYDALQTAAEEEAGQGTAHPPIRLDGRQED